MLVFLAEVGTDHLAFRGHQDKISPKVLLIDKLVEDAVEICRRSHRILGQHGPRFRAPGQGIAPLLVVPILVGEGVRHGAVVLLVSHNHTRIKIEGIAPQVKDQRHRDDDHHIPNKGAPQLGLERRSVHRNPLLYKNCRFSFYYNTLSHPFSKAVRPVDAPPFVGYTLRSLLPDTLKKINRETMEVRVRMVE